MSIRGGLVPTSLYDDTGFAGAWNCVSVRAPTLALKSLSPSNWPYVTVLPPPETTPLSTLRLATGTPSCAAAMPSSACRAYAAPARTCGPAVRIELDPYVPPVSGVTFVSTLTQRICEMSMPSSSAAIISSPSEVPCPSSTRPDLIVAVLSPWIATHESIEFGSYGALLANGLSAACALPASTPSELKPTTSAPPPFRNDRRDSDPAM